METKNIKDQIKAYTKKLVILLVIVFVSVVGILATIILFRNSSQILSAKREAVAEGASGWYDAQIARVGLITDSLESRDFTSYSNKENQQYLANLMSENEAVFDYYYGLEDGTCVFGGGWEPAPGEYDPKTRDWYQQSIASDDVYVSESYVDAETGRIVFTVAKALKKDGKPIGVFAADFFTDELTEMTNELTDSSGFPILVDSAGTVITHKNKANIPTADKDGNMVAKTYKDLGISKSLIANKKVTKNFGGAYVYSAEYIPQAKTTVIFAMPLFTYIGSVVMFFVICIILLIIALIFSARGITRVLEQLFAPLGELGTVADNMTNGILDYNATYTKQDEIGELCVAIEQSNATIRGYIDDIGEKLALMSQGDLTVNVDEEYIGNFASLKDSINGISDSLRNTMEIIVNASNAVYDSAENVAKSAGGLSSEVENVGEVVSGVDTQIAGIQEGFDKSIDIAKESMNLSVKAKDYLSESYELINELTTAMTEITEKSNSIAEIINIINGIADQTNLLALNASIEAARAGEAGKGFAVVADSVRELANQTSQAAANTTDLIEQSTVAVSRGNAIVEKTTKSMEQVVELTENVNQHVAEIVENIDGETQMLTDVSNRVKSMEVFAQDTKATSQECVALSDELYDQVNLMKEKIAEFKI